MLFRNRFKKISKKVRLFSEKGLKSPARCGIILFVAPKAEVFGAIYTAEKTFKIFRFFSEKGVDTRLLVRYNISCVWGRVSCAAPRTRRGIVV